MSNRKPSFAKRQREADLKDKAKAKAARLDARRASAPKGGPPIDWDAQAPATDESAGTDDLPADDSPAPPAPDANES